MIKTCNRCQQEELHDIRKSGRLKGKPQWLCKKCVVIYNAELYQRKKEEGKLPVKDPDYQRAAHKKSVKKKRDIVYGMKEASPCSDCNVFYPYWVMDYDHREGEEKIGSIQSLLKTGPFKKCLQEIEKCDLVCANCHRTRTFQRMNKEEIE